MAAVCIRLAVFAWLILEAAAEDKQARVLAGAERVWHVGARPPAEAIRLVVVTHAVAIERSQRASQIGVG